MECYINLGNFFHKTNKDFINAAALYNFALGICSDEGKNKQFIEKTKDHYQTRIINKLVAIEKDFLKSVGKETKLSDSELLQQYKRHKNKLNDIQIWAKNELALVNLPDPMLENPSLAASDDFVEDQPETKHENLPEDDMQTFN